MQQNLFSITWFVMLCCDISFHYAFERKKAINIEKNKTRKKEGKNKEIKKERKKERRSERKT